MVNWQDLDVDEMLEWPIQAQTVAILIFIFALQIVGYWFYLKPENQRLNDLVQKEQSLRTEFQIKANRAAALPQLQSQVDELTSRYEQLLLQLPAEKELATMLASINQLGIDSNLKFTRMDWGQKQVEHFFYRLPLELELTGDFHDIGRFTQAMAALPRIIVFQDVIWQRVSQESESLHFRIKANTYQLKSEDNKNEK
ncbi:assembly protein PilO [Vibrio sp. B1REV9]|uniref:type 4a pilus biogenesis protein PilO n=1 Tax=Vibrio sp. B1REV9 TaxID=2751179 RepID=UPI001AFAE538|nr:type 4a pilus biogenesis protein PilO [Vibrio sp. B1REV9]CAE6889412.1 assembly protein PilO [Vibrio sp. B1REV9]